MIEESLLHEIASIFNELSNNSPEPTVTLVAVRKIIETDRMRGGFIPRYAYTRLNKNKQSIDDWLRRAKGSSRLAARRFNYHSA